MRNLLSPRLTISIVGALLGFSAVVCHIWIEPDNDTSTEIRAVESAIDEAFADFGTEKEEVSSDTGKKYRLICLGPPWKEVERITSPLSWSNQRIAKAKVMLRYDSNPSEYNSYLWNERYSVAIEAWTIEDYPQKILKTLGYGSLAFLCVFVVMFIFLWVLRWSWHFLLSRIRELAQAFRGQ